jgi:glutamyl/glutaminyl-tRNA synthetase
MPQTVVTRFAPSPTGYLHVGGARTALFNWLLARKTGGQFLLRIEDTDLARSTDDACRQLIEDLNWLGLKWDNAQLVYQSKRLAIYNKIIDDLMSRGQAYEAWETNAELDSLREAASKAKRPFLYKRPNYTPDQIRKYKDEGRTPVIRFVMPVKEFRFHDLVADKEIVQSPYESQDFVIRKTDGMPTYHFGVVVDDAEMGITHVLRGLEHLKNTFNHVALQEALGYARPTYAHLSVMLNPENGQKLSKRDRDGRIRRRTQDWMRSTKKTVDDLQNESGIAAARLKTWLDVDTTQLDLTEQPRVMAVVGLKESDLPEIMIHDFRKNGYTPEVLLNFLALQGWSPGGDLEKMTIAELVDKFSLDRLIASNPKFNREKLKSFSTDFFSAAPIDRQLSALRDWLGANPASVLHGASDAQLVDILKMNAGYHVLSEIEEKIRFFFAADDGIVFDAKSVDKILRKDDDQGVKTLGELATAFESIDLWTTTSIEAAINGFAGRTGLGLGKIAQPIRVAISGSGVTPPIFETLAFLGKSKTISRIKRCVAVHSA